jgi:glucoamylase
MLCIHTIAIFGSRKAANVIAVALLILSVLFGEVHALDATDGPGDHSSWTTGAKEGIGTSATSASKIWFTLGQGITHEVYFPQIDVPNVQDLQFIVSDRNTFVDLERDATNHEVLLPDPQALTYRQVNTAKSGRYRITKTYVTDIDRPVLLMQTRFEVLSGGPYDLYVLYNPSLNGSGGGDSGASTGNALVASDGNVASALIASPDFVEVSNGYAGSKGSDGLVDLRNAKRLTTVFDAAPSPGNLVQIGQISVGQDTTFVLALGFGATRQEATDNANASLATNFATQQSRYQEGWHAYLSPLAVPSSVTGSAQLRTQYNVALMVLKALEDKTNPGAGIAALATPWGDVVGADGCCVFDDQHGGYQSVFARDLYEVATAQLAAGDKNAAGRYLDFLFNKQQRDNGSFPRHSRVNGNDLGGATQMDEVSYPIILAWQLDRTDAATWAKVQKSADFIVESGPRTDKERWEEQFGFSPSTIAAEIAALVCAADIADKNSKPGAAATYRRKADDWQQNIENWTFTTSGVFPDKRYYIRIDDDQNPNDGHPIDIANNGGRHDEREIIDAGFLELTRLGVKPFTDQRIAESLPEVDAIIKGASPSGDMYHRYNFDGYGERDDSCKGFPAHHAGKGGFWPLLNGERGEYELIRHNPLGAKNMLEILAKAANSGFLIPEQVFDRTVPACGFALGVGTGSATPLAWSMAQFVRLALSIDAGQPVETPQIVAKRYPPADMRSITFNITVPASTAGTGRAVIIAGELDKLDASLPHWNPAGVHMTKVDPTHWTTTFSGPVGTTVQYKYVLEDWKLVEKDSSCSERANRSVTLTSGTGSQVVKETVENWRTVTPCGGD